MAEPHYQQGDPLLRRETSADQAAALLRRRITDGLLEPGLQLREEQLAAVLGISRNTIREAFRMLGHEGLIVHEPYRGVFVRVMTVADVEDIFRTRRLLEPLGVDALVRDPAAAATLLDIVAAAEEAAAALDWRRVGSANLDLHRAIVESCRSTRMNRLFTQLFAELRLAFLLTGDARAMHEPYLARNRSVAELIARGEGQAAQRDLARYLDQAERHVIDAITAA